MFRSATVTDCSQAVLVCTTEQKSSVLPLFPHRQVFSLAKLRKKGYNPINQLVGYILSEDPTYITTYNNARSLIRHIDRDELLQAMVKNYLGS